MGKGGKWLRYIGEAVFETDEKYAQISLGNAPQLKNIYNETTGHKLMMIHREDAMAVIISMMGEDDTIDC